MSDQKEQKQSLLSPKSETSLSKKHSGSKCTQLQNLSSVEVLNALVKEKLNAPLENDVLTFDGHSFFFRNERLGEDMTYQMVKEARFIQQSKFFEYMIKDMWHEGVSTAAVESKNWDDVMFGKALMYLSDMIAKKVLNASRIPLPDEKYPAH